MIPSLFIQCHPSGQKLKYSQRFCSKCSQIMSHLARADTQIKQEVGFTTSPLPSCSDASRCGKNSGQWQMQTNPKRPLLRGFFPSSSSSTATARTQRLLESTCASHFCVNSAFLGTNPHNQLCCSSHKCMTNSNGTSL